MNPVIVAAIKTILLFIACSSVFVFGARRIYTDIINRCNNTITFDQHDTCYETFEAAKRETPANWKCFKTKNGEVCFAIKSDVSKLNNFKINTKRLRND